MARARCIWRERCTSLALESLLPLWRSFVRVRPAVDLELSPDELTLADFEPGTITDPLPLPAGEYAIDVREAGAEASADPAITAAATLEGGSNVSLVAHLRAGRRRRDPHARREARALPRSLPGGGTPSALPARLFRRHGPGCSRW